MGAGTGWNMGPAVGIWFGPDARRARDRPGVAERNAGDGAVTSRGVASPGPGTLSLGVCFARMVATPTLRPPLEGTNQIARSATHTVVDRTHKPRS